MPPARRNSPQARPVREPAASAGVGCVARSLASLEPAGAAATMWRVYAAGRRGALLDPALGPRVRRQIHIAPVEIVLLLARIGESDHLHLPLDGRRAVGDDLLRDAGEGDDGALVRLHHALEDVPTAGMERARLRRRLAVVRDVQLLAGLVVEV